MIKVADTDTGLIDRTGPSARSLSPLDRVRQWRNLLLASPRFQRWAAEFPLTRTVARREARAAFDLCAGFVYSQVLMACVRLDLFELLARGPLSVDAVAARTRLPRQSVERLLSAAVSLRLIERRSAGRYGVGALGAAISGNRAITDMITHHDMLYRDLANPEALLRGQVPETELSRYWAYAGQTRVEALAHNDVAGYTNLMASSLDLIAADILDAFPLPTPCRLLDIGGGDGAFALYAAKRHKALNVTVLDVPAVAAMATERFAAAGMAERCKAIGGDMFATRHESSYDVVTLIRIVLDHDDESARKLLAQASRALRPGGTLLIAEPQAGVRGAEAMGSAYFGFYLLAMGQGRARTFNDIRNLLGDLGFAAIASIATRRPLIVSLTTAKKK